jgi:pimeloyl-ACP methyl ester carboxylesterase
MSMHDPLAGDLEFYGSHDAGPTARSPVLLVHSINAAASAFEIRPLFERLALSRPTYAIDLPGFGRSDRSDRIYSPRLMTDAILAAVAAIRGRHGGVRVDALALSLSCESLARAAIEAAGAFRTLGLVSPTGLGRRRFDGPAGGNRGLSLMRSILRRRWIGGPMYRLLTRPRVIRYFLARTFGRPEIDPDLWAYAILTAGQPGAEHAPLWFLSGHLFSTDATQLYEALPGRVWLSHGVRGDFVDYRGADAVLERRRGWSRDIFDTGALPHFELPDAFAAAYLAFLDAEPGVNST